MQDAMTISGHAIILVWMTAPLFAPASGAQADGIEQTESETREALDPTLAAELEAIDRRVAQIRDLTTDFEERKFTALLKNPLISRGRMRILGSRTRWDTFSPQPTAMIVDATGISIYYPQRSTLEVYQLDEKLKWLAVSPLPQLTALLDRFTIERIPVADSGDAGSAGTYLGLCLRPRDEALRKYLRRVDVVLNTTTAFIVRVEMLDADGDRTVISFSNMRPNTGLDNKDVELTVPAGTQIVRPLAGLEKESTGTPP